MNLNEIFENNTNLVGFVLSRLCGYAPENHRDDLMQEGYLALWKCCQQFDESRGTQFSTYAVSAIYYRMISYLREHVYAHKNVVSLSDPVGDDTEGRDLKLEDIIGKDEDILFPLILEDYLNKLKPKDQQIIRLLICGYTQQEISTMLSVSQPYVSRRLSKFRDLLRKEEI